jgi:hypothetical protein
MTGLAMAVLVVVMSRSKSCGNLAEILVDCRSFGAPIEWGLQVLSLRYLPTV